MSLNKKRIKEYIVPIPVFEVNLKDRKWLDKALEKDYDEGSLEEIFEKATLGFAQIWRLGDSEGILVSEVIQRKNARELWLPLLAGRGVFKCLDLIEDRMVLLGKEFGCKVIRWVGQSKGLNKVYSKRWKKIASIYEREI